MRRHPAAALAVGVALTLSACPVEPTGDPDDRIEDPDPEPGEPDTPLAPDG